MTIEQVRAAAVALAAQITQQLQTFEQTTGCKIHSIPITHEPALPVTANVKVKL